MRKLGLMLMMALLMMTLTACKSNPSESELYETLFSYFQSAGYDCVLMDVDADQEVPIHEAESWKMLKLDDHEMLIYFDESNRADYLLTTIDQTKYGKATHFGLRFILVYEGDDIGILDWMNQIDQME